MSDETIEQCAERIVRQEVLLCVSALVSTLCQGFGSTGATLDELCEKAMELAAPVDDWEEAAIQAGWHQDEHGDWHDRTGLIYRGGITVEDLCAKESLDPYQREVFEHWAVSRWLADKLIEHGEKVDTDFEGLNVWARTCTGQGIACDGVMLQIARDIKKA